MEKGAWAGFGACVPDNFIGGGLAEFKSVTCDNVTLTRTDKELTADDYTFSEHLLTIKTAGDYTLSGTANSKDFRVKVGEKVGEKASRIQTTLTIENLTINTYRDEKKEEAKQGYSPLDFSEAGETTLTLVGANHLTARGNNPAVFAPWVNSGDGDDDKDAIPLTIDGDGSLVAKGGRAWPGIGNNGSAKICIKSGDITAEGGGTGSSGIGGSWGFSFDSIVIEGGHIRAIAKSDPKWENDIGNGEGIPDYDTGHGQGRKHTILIKGGVVEAGRVYGQGRREDRTKLTHTGGTLIQNGNRTYMSDATLDEKLTISSGKTMKIGENATVTIGKNGGLEIEDGATLYVDGTVKGDITGNGKIYYKLNYDLDGGEWVDGYTPGDYYLSDTEFELPTEENLNKAGYKFLGWKDKNTDEVVGKIPTSATGIKNVAAQWAEEYTVSFNANGGTETSETRTVTYGNPYGELPTLTREGYTFEGWFTAQNGGTQVTAVTTVTTAADHMLYAHWTANEYTVTFNANGGTVTPAEQTVTYGSTYGELPTLTREGYTFAGWFTEKDVGTQVTAVTTVTTAADHMLYAHWTANTHTVKFDANEGTVTSAEQTVTYGSHYGELPTPTREGYTFVGWFTKKDGGTQVTKETVVKTVADHTLYARWTKNSYEVKFDANGGAVTPETMTVTYGDVYGELPTPTREGYTFAGWFTEKEYGTQVTAVTKVTTAGKHTLYAHWTQNIYDVRFDANGGKEAYESEKVFHGDAYGKFPPDPTRIGYKFAGWFTEKDGGNDKPVKVDTKVTASHTLYAHWTAKKYTVTFDANGGTVTPADAEMTVTYGNPYGKLPEPTRKGYTFVGWFTNPNGGTQVKADAEVTTAANRTLHAHWTQNIHTVTIKDDKDGKVIETQQIPEGGLAKKPAKEPVREGYTFVGWQANGAAWDFDQNVVERDTEIIALWEKVVIAPDVAIEGGTSFIVGRATENAMVTIGHNVPGFGVANLAYVDVDGKKLNEKDYDAKTGSIKLNVHAAYLNTLSVGEHTLTAHLKGDGYDGQKVSAKLTVSPVPDASGLPKTGDASAPMAWCALGLACLAGLAAMKRRK